MRGKARDDAHRTRHNLPEGVLRWGMGYLFMGWLAQTGATAGSSACADQPGGTTGAAAGSSACASQPGRKGRTDRARPVFNNRDEKSGAVFPVLCPKGSDAYALAATQEALRFTGRAAVILLVDQERSIKTLTEEVRKERARETTLLNTPKGSSTSAGGVERANYEVAMQVQTLGSRAEQSYETHIDTDRKLLPWMVRHAGWLITHYQVKADGETPY